jgi:hypothetical protein
MPAIANDLGYVARACAARTAIITVGWFRAITARMRARLSFFVCHVPASLLKKIFKV